MESARSTCVLVVANRTAATPHLLDEIARRAKDGRCEFALLIPDVADRKAGDWTLETALRLMRQAAKGRVEGLIGGPDPFASTEKVVRWRDFDEIISSTRPRRVSKWLQRDLIRHVQGL
jgi:hypothetical protein